MRSMLVEDKHMSLPFLANCGFWIDANLKKPQANLVISPPVLTACEMGFKIGVNPSLLLKLSLEDNSWTKRSAGERNSLNKNSSFPVTAMSHMLISLML